MPWYVWGPCVVVIGAAMGIIAGLLVLALRPTTVADFANACWRKNGHALYQRVADNGPSGDWSAFECVAGDGSRITLP